MLGVQMQGPPKCPGAKFVIAPHMHKIQACQNTAMPRQTTIGPPAVFSDASRSSQIFSTFRYSTCSVNDVGFGKMNSQQLRNKGDQIQLSERSPGRAPIHLTAFDSTVRHSKNWRLHRKRFTNDFHIFLVTSVGCFEPRTTCLHCSNGYYSASWYPTWTTCVNGELDLLGQLSQRNTQSGHLWPTYF